MKVILLSLLVLAVIGFAEIQAQESVEIPIWVKGVANFWVEDKIDDGEFAEALEFLIDNNIIQLGNSTTVSEQEGLSENEKTLLELQISDRDRIISDLEKNVEDIGLTNSQLLNNVVEITESHDQIQSEFEKYKQDYPLKIGNIGGKLVVDYIQELEDRISELEN